MVASVRIDDVVEGEEDDDEEEDEDEDDEDEEDDEDDNEEGDEDEMMTDKNICEYANKSSAFENKPA